MIFISSSCINAENIKDSVNYLIDNGFNNIELSGGTKYYSELENNLISIKKNKDVNFLLHNYFPPSRNPFVLNLASLNDEIYNRSIQHYKHSIDLSKILGAKKYGIHAGFLIDPGLSELGEKITKNSLYNRVDSINRFCDAYRFLDNYSDEIDIYIENNVLSFHNNKIFEANPFLFTDFESYEELSKHIDFKILFDIAHLKVSCNSLSLSFEEQFLKFAKLSDYIHVSDNNGIIDSNGSISENSEVFKLLSKINIKHKTVTLEIYEDLDNIIESYNLISDKLLK